MNNIPIAEAAYLTTVILGIHKIPEEYRWAYRDANVHMGLSPYVLDGIPCAEDEIELDLMRTSGRRLGFDKSAYYGDICEKSQKNLGFMRCPREVVLALGLVSGSLPITKLYVIVNTPVRNAAGNRQILVVEKDATGCSVYESPMPTRLEPDDELVLVRPK